MKHILSLRHISFAVLICGMFLVTNCTGVINSLDDYSGETLYSSAVESPDNLLDFAPDIQSDVQKHLDTEKQKKAFAEFQRDFITRLIQENPGLAREFHHKMTSDDRQQVNQALEDAGQLVEQELQALTGQQEITAENVVMAVLKKYEVDTPSL